MSTYCTRIYVKVDAKELMEKLCALDVADLGKGFYLAEDIFDASSTESNFYDSESGINENDLEVLVARAVDVIKGQGTILADTFSYDYDPFPQAFCRSRCRDARLRTYCQKHRHPYEDGSF